ALDADFPRRRDELADIRCGVGRARAELVEIVVAGDVFPRVHFFIRKPVLARLDAFQFPAMWCALRFENGFGSERYSSQRSRGHPNSQQELAAVYVLLSIRNF